MELHVSPNVDPVSLALPHQDLVPHLRHQHHPDKRRRIAPSRTNRMGLVDRLLPVGLLGFALVEPQHGDVDHDDVDR